MKSILAKISHGFERVFDKMRRPQLFDAKTVMIEPYMGYATPTHMRLRGRVLVTRNPRKTHAKSSRRYNFIAMAELFITDEIGHTPISIPYLNLETTTDEEGYFDCLAPVKDPALTEYEVIATDYNVRMKIPVQMSEPDAAYSIISDIDDTVLKTEAWSLMKNAWNSLTGNTHTRYIFPDAVTFFDRLRKDNNPVFYVSSSPWNFHRFLRDIFDRSGLPDAPFFLRDYGIGPDQFIIGTHGEHKFDAISQILTHHPNLNFVLIGDLGQHDPMIYAQIVKHFPQRIVRVVFKRTPNSDEIEKLKAVREIEQRNIPVHVVTDYDHVDLTD